MSSSYPYLLVLVEGPSEARDDDPGHESSGVVRTVIAEVFGVEVARNIKVDYWRHMPRSPLREHIQGQRISGRGAQVRRAVEIADTTTAYGAVILVDNDHLYDGCRPRRLEELRQGLASSERKDRAAIGVAQEMVEAWLLADPDLLGNPLPAGKQCDDLWGDRHDPNSNYPKHVLERCVLRPKRLSFAQAVERWSPSRARAHSPSLDAFIRQVEELAKRQYAC